MPAQALYLKWRPQTLDEVVGQEHVTTTLRNALKQDKVRHAYLFSGPRGTGKTSIARLLAKAVNCLAPDPADRPCNACEHCVAVNEGRFLDLIEIDAASHTSVDDVRDLRDKIAFSPSQGHYKVYIIDEVHRFSGAAFDALLKTLEEPPDHALFVLATTEIDKVPATIKSRCQRFDFRRIATAHIVARLDEMVRNEGLEADPRALELVARQATGSLRDAISLLDQLVADPGEYISRATAEAVLGISGNQAIGEVVQAIIDRNTAAGLEAINNAVDAGAEPRQMAREIVEWLRNVLMLKTGGPNLIDVSDTVRDTVAAQAQAADAPQLLRSVKAFNEAVYNARGGWQPQLPLELALIESTQTPQAAPAPAPQPSPQPQRPEPSPPPRKTSPPPTQPSPPPSTPAPQTQQPAESGKINVGILQQRWEEILQQVTKSDPTRLASGLLKNTQPIRYTQDILVLNATSEVIQEKLERHLSVLSSVLQKMFDIEVKVQVKTGLDIEATNPTQNPGPPSAQTPAETIDPIEQEIQALGGVIQNKTPLDN